MSQHRGVLEWGGEPHCHGHHHAHGRHMHQRMQILFSKDSESATSTRSSRTYQHSSRNQGLECGLRRVNLS
jgi:hypothetical protein